MNSSNVRWGCGLLAVCGLLAIGKPAQALTYTVSNNLESAPSWIPSVSLAGGFSYWDTSSSAHSGTKIFTLGFNDTVSEDDYQDAWVSAHRVFYYDPAPAPKSCKATIWVKGNYWFDNYGYVEMIDNTTWSYIGQKYFTANLSWTQITVTNTWACTRSIALRVVELALPGTATLVYIDDGAVTWTY